MLESLKSKILDWLAPGLLDQINSHHLAIQANYDIHCCNLPAGPKMWEEAIANCQALQGELEAGNITERERALSLIEALKRKGILRPKEAQ